MGDGSFRSATNVTADGEHRWRARIVEGWDIAGNANGGYLLALATRALLEATGRPDPVTTTAHYLAPGIPGSVSITTGVLRAGRQLATGTSVLAAADRPLLAVLGTTGDLGVDRGPHRHVAPPAALPEPDECVLISPTDTFPPPFMGEVEVRLHPEDAAFFDGSPSGRARMRGWFRHRGDEEATSLSLLCAADAFPPTIFNADVTPSWTPTIELTVHVRARPAPGWLACRFESRFVTGGFLEVDGEIWDDDGRLVAQSRQLALVPKG